MTPKQIIHHFQEGNDTENSQENAKTEDHISDCRLKPVRHWWYQCQAPNCEDEPRVEGGEATLQQRSRTIFLYLPPVARRQSNDIQHECRRPCQGIETIIKNALCPPSYTLLRKRGADPQLQPGPIRSKTKRTYQAEAGALRSLPDSGASSRRLTFLDKPIAKIEVPR